MQFDSFSEFVAMGGHGLYVWLAYGATVAVLLVSSVALRLARRKHLQRLRWTLEAQAVESKRADNPAGLAVRTEQAARTNREAGEQ